MEINSKGRKTCICYHRIIINTEGSEFSYLDSVPMWYSKVTPYIISVSFNKSLKTFRERQFYSSCLIGYRILLWAYLLDHVIVNLRSCLLLYSLNWEENRLSIKQSIYTSLCVFQLFHNLKEILQRHVLQE